MIYTLTCPDEDCGHEIKHEAEPATFLEGGDLIKCPKCGEEWEWDFAPDEDPALILVPDDDEEDGDGFEDEEDEEDDE